MQSPSRFSITPVAAAVTAAMYPGHDAIAQDAQRSQAALEEIIVTATKRSLSTQDIPASVQAITQESLAQMGAKSMEDYARFIPSVNVVTYGAGSSTVVFRGAITGAGYIAQSTSSVYLDEISITNSGSQPNIRAVDVARVEALSGPQGTLYGSDAQAGTMRIITNQPVMNSFEAVFDGEVRGGDESEMSYRGSLVFNIPLVEDKLAMRVVGFNDHDGGFVDNVFGHTADAHAFGETWGARQDPLYPSGWGTLDNAEAVEEDWNDADIYGGRVHLKWDMSDTWSVTGSYHHQTTDSGADNYYDPFVGDLKVVRFLNESREETFDMGSVVVEGDMGFAQLVAAVSYYERDILGKYDITTYAHYWAAKYCHDGYYIAGSGIAGDPYSGPYYFGNPDTGYYVWAPYCQGPTVDGDFFSSYVGPSNDDKLTTEIRLSHTGDTFDWILGFYYEDSQDSWVAPFATPVGSADPTDYTFQQSPAARFWEFYWSNYYGTPVTYPDATSNWYSQSKTDWEQKAAFGEIEWHITDTLDLTLGGRLFERTNTNYYIVNHPGGPSAGFGTNGEPDFYDGDAGPGTSENRQERLAAGLDNPIGRTGKDEEFIPKVSLRWGFSDDAMVYGLYTRGKRPGGVNRSRGQPFFPNQYNPDLMDNYEIGYKSNFAGGQGRFNATLYHMVWQDYQLELVDPASVVCADPDGTPNDDKIDGVCGQPWQQVVGNAGDAHITGLNLELDYAINENWLVGMNYEKMEAETDTNVNTDDEDGFEIVAGLRLPIVPSYKASAWLEYSAPASLFGAQNWFFRTQWSHTGDSLNILEPIDMSDPNPQFKNPAYTIGDVRLGLQGEDWEASFFINNVTDERATYTTNTGMMEWAAAQVAEGRPHHQTLYTNRPLEMGVRFMKRWGD